MDQTIEEKPKRGRPKTLSEDTKPYTIHLPESLVNQLDHYCDLINSKDIPGKPSKVSRTDLIRIMLEYRISNTTQAYQEAIERQRRL